MEIKYIPLLLTGPALWLLLFVLLPSAWHALGRRRTEARLRELAEERLHEEGKRRLLRARDKVKASLRTNGADSSAPPRSPGPANGRSR